MNRRHFIKNTGLLGLSVLLSPMLKACKKLKNDTPIIIIGAGIAGLAAARHLKNNNFTNVKVLEARNRIGGRVYTDRSLGLPIDLGASWIHGPGGNNPITPIANEANVNTFLTDDDSLIVYNQDGTAFSEATVDAMETNYNNLITSIENVGAVSKSVETAINEVNAAYLSDLLMQYHLSAYMEFDGGGAISELSSLHWADDEVFPGKDVIATNGYDGVANKLAENIDIQLNTVVTQVDYSGENINIETAGQGSFVAKYVICTLPLGVLKGSSVGFNPALPDSISGAISRLKMGHVNKVILTFPSVFWDNVQYIGYCDAVKGKYPYFVNCSKFLTTPALMTFGLGDYGLVVESQTDAQIQSDVMGILRTIYGTAIPDPTGILVSRWGNEEYSKGAYSFGTVGATNADFDAFDTNIDDKLFFAGEHTISDYRSTVHGAYLTGVREADKIIGLE